MMGCMGRKRLLFRANAVGNGIDDHALQRMCNQGDLARVRPGVYATPGDAATDITTRHVIAVHAAMAKQRTNAVVSHVSAAAIHGLPLWDLSLAQVHLTQPGTAGGHTTRRRHQHMAHLSPAQVTEVGGLPVSTVARTIVDLARTVQFDRAVAVGDAALNNAMTTVDELLTEIERLPGRSGAKRARAAVLAMDPRSESIGESWSRIVMDRAGLPPRDLQRVIRVNGDLLGRADYFFDEHGIVGEFDGRVKYSRQIDDPRDPGEIAWDEKKREDRLRDAGLEVMRWTWADLAAPHRLLSLFDSARRRAEASPAPIIDAVDPRDAYVPRRRVRPRTL